MKNEIDGKVLNSFFYQVLSETIEEYDEEKELMDIEFDMELDTVAIPYEWPVGNYITLMNIILATAVECDVSVYIRPLFRDKDKSILELVGREIYDEESTELHNNTRICPWCKKECVEGFDFNYDEGMCDFCYDTEKGLNYED